jgi:hypothetical protein
MYLEFAHQAQEAGDRAAADRFEEVRHDEMGHRDAFQVALKALEAATYGVQVAASEVQVARTGFVIFLAYGLTTMDLRLIGIPFFLGRSISYGFWGLTSSAVSRRIAMESTQALSYLSGYFIASQILLLYLIYLFTKIDWRALFGEKKLRRIPRKAKNSLSGADSKGPS